MLMKFSWFVLLIILGVCQTAPLFDNDDDNSYNEMNNRLQSLNSDELAGLIKLLAHRSNKASAFDLSDQDTRHSNENYISKRDALWTTTEVLDCVRRLKYSKNGSKLDLVTEMLNCYRRLKHSG